MNSMAAKKYMIIPSFFAAMRILPLHADTGHSVGGGGSGIVCRDESHNITSIEVYDYYEARMLRHAIIDLGDPRLSYKQLADTALSRLARLSPLRAQRYREEIAAFESESNILDDSSLFPIPDLGPGGLQPPPGCTLEQLAYQQEPQFPGQERYRINGTFWNKMTEVAKAGLVLHEVIYREAMSYGLQNSIGARYFNATFAQANAEQLSAQTFYGILRGIPFLETDIVGRNLRIGICYKSDQAGRRLCSGPKDVKEWQTFEYYPSGNLKSVTADDHDDNPLFELGMCFTKGKFVFGVSELLLEREKSNPNQDDYGLVCGIKMYFDDDLSSSFRMIEDVSRDRFSYPALAIVNRDVVTSWGLIVRLGFYSGGQIAEVWGGNLRFADGHHVDRGIVYLKIDGTVDRVEDFPARP